MSKTLGLPELTLPDLKGEAKRFAIQMSSTPIPGMHRTTDGKAVGTYIEHAFNDYLSQKYLFSKGNTASGIDFPDLEVDLKVTSIRQPQSSVIVQPPHLSSPCWGEGWGGESFIHDLRSDTPCSEGLYLSPLNDYSHLALSEMQGRKYMG
jgi:hypothetical protein